MNRIQFWILNLLSVLIAALVAFELASSNKLDETELLAKDAQIPLLQAQQMQPLAQRMLQRTAQGAVNDPALKDLLAKYGFHLDITPSQPVAAPPVASPAPSTETTSNP